MKSSKNEPECLVCDYCSFEEGNGSPSRWYCMHEQNPDAINARTGAGGGIYKIINKGQRHDKFNNIPRQRVPRWCPFKKNNWEGF